MIKLFHRVCAQAGTTFPPITSVAVLKTLELECVYSAGIIPTAIPLGFYYGTPLSLGHNVPLANLIRVVWKGKYATRLYCRDTAETKTVIWNLLRGVPYFSASVLLRRAENQNVPLGRALGVSYCYN